jgi:copper homeostasis protein
MGEPGRHIAPVGTHAEQESIRAHLEVCIECSDPMRVRRSAMNARRGGASRVELCRNMRTGGLTPDLEDVRVAVDAFGRANGVMVMIRPRAGGFEYTKAEVAEMERQISAAGLAGADGVVFGLVESGTIAWSDTRRLTQAANSVGLSVTFHRAFDLVDDPLQAIDGLAEIGVARILTSGTLWEGGGTALDGADALARYVTHAAGRIEIVIGGGVTRANVRDILRKLPPGSGPVSVHAWSDLTVEGVTDCDRVEAMVEGGG